MATVTEPVFRPSHDVIDVGPYAYQLRSTSVEGVSDVYDMIEYRQLGKIIDTSDNRCLAFTGADGQYVGLGSKRSRHYAVRAIAAAHGIATTINHGR